MAMLRFEGFLLFLEAPSACWGENAFLNQCGTHRYAVREIDSQYSNGGSADGGAPAKLSTGPAKVTLPAVPPWVEEANEATAPRIDARQVRSLVAVAEKARQGQVSRPSQSAVAQGNDVIDLERERIVFLGHPAIFAA